MQTSTRWLNGLRAACLVFLVLLAPVAYAAPAAPVQIPLAQPDGTRFTATARGDEYGSWLETLSGHSIVQAGNTWFYAVRNPQGQLVPGPHAVGTLSDEDLESLPQHVAPDRRPPEQRTIRKIPRPQAAAAPGLDEPATISHTQNVLIILVDYTDITFTYLDASFQALMFADTDSVKEYYLENSYGGFTIVPAAESYGTANDGVVHVTRPVVHPNIGLGPSGAEAIEIVKLADASVDYSAFDTNADGTVSTAELSIVIILAGYEHAFGGNADAPTPRVWGHATGFSTNDTFDGMSLRPYTMFGEIHGSIAFPAFDHQATIGIMAHELGHLMLGLPDLYDYDGSSRGIGDWGLMGGGTWNFTGTESGDSPAHLSAWSKVATNFTAPTLITGTALGETFTDASANEDAKKLWIDKYQLSEYFLLENRQQSGFDAGLPGNGLLIWHIDESRINNDDESHKMVDLEAADGNSDMDTNTNPGDANDPFYSGNNSDFNDASTPNSKNYNGETTNISVTEITSSSASMSADVNAPPPTGDHVRYDENGNTATFSFGSTTVWLGYNLLNDTGLETLEGVEVFTRDLIGGTVDVFYYQSMAGGTPTDLIYSETGLPITRGWTRILFATPQSFPDTAERGVVVKINNDSFTGTIVLDNNEPASGRSYFSNTGAGSFSALGSCGGTPICGDVNLVALFGSGVDNPPEATVITPGTTGPTNAGSVDFAVTFSEDVVNFNDASDVVVNHTGTANSGISISGSGASYTVSVTGITGDGSFTLAASTGSDIEDSAGQALVSSVTSEAVAIDNTSPGVQISAPSVAATNTGPVSYTITYTDADVVTLAEGDVILNTAGTANGSVSVSGSGTSTRTVTINSITGTGSIGISLAFGTADDQAGNGAPETGPSATFNVDNTLPVATEITPATTGPTNATSISFDITFSEAVVNFDSADDLTIVHTGTAHTGVSISGAGLSYSADVTGISGTGSFTVSVNTGSDVEDTNGNALSGSVQSAAVTIDNTPPELAISAPSVNSTVSGPVSYTVDFTGADAVTLANGNVSLNTTGTANASTIEVTGSGTAQRTVTLSGITGDGTIGISIAAGTASDTAGNLAGSVGPSQTFAVGQELEDLIHADGFEEP